MVACGGSLAEAAGAPCSPADSEDKEAASRRRWFTEQGPQAANSEDTSGPVNADGSDASAPAGRGVGRAPQAAVVWAPEATHGDPLGEMLDPAQQSVVVCVQAEALMELLQSQEDYSIIM